MSHTILLLQYNEDYSSRTYLEFASLREALDGTIRLYEVKLRELNPGVQDLSYSADDLFSYIDSINDLAVMVADNTVGKYDPRGRDWLKGKMFEHLQRQAA